MPELPEVETIKNDLKKFVLNKKITLVDIKLNRLIKSDLAQFGKVLKNNSFTDIKRTGKLLQFDLKKTPNLHLLIHLKMTGQLVYRSTNDTIAGGHSLPKIHDCLPNKYTYVTFKFQDKSRLFFSDLRTFGALKIVNNLELQNTLEKFGIEPLQPNFKLKDLKKIFTKRKANIKSVLLNQQLICGIGNIYADEILFRSGILPFRSANALNDFEIKKIYNSTNLIIKKAIASRGTTFNNYVDGQGNRGSFLKLLKVYGRGGKECGQCGHRLTKIKLNGRGTVFCSICQK